LQSGNRLTDYDTSDRLYFEPLTLEDVPGDHSQGTEKGSLAGVIVQFGGQTAEAGQRLRARACDPGHQRPTPIGPGGRRKRFQKLLNELGLKQPPNATVMTPGRSGERGAAGRLSRHPASFPMCWAGAAWWWWPTKTSSRRRPLGRAVPHLGRQSGADRWLSQRATEVDVATRSAT